MDEQEAELQEPRWPVALAVLAVGAMLIALPGRIRLAPQWTPMVIAVVELIPLAGVALTHGKPSWRRAEKIITLTIVALSALSIFVSLGELIDAMVLGGSQLSGLTLLSSSVAVWASNVLTFSLLYWQLDRGGPWPRGSRAACWPDWIFPQEGAPEGSVRPGWEPSYVDYLFLAFSTATAFSPTDALPVSARAKLLMLLQSLISLVTIVLVGARAVNLLGS